MQPARLNEITPAMTTSLRSSFAWTFAGNAVYAAGQWAILSLAAKIGGIEMLGQYALAVAVASPAVMLSHLNLRATLATDMNGEHPFGDYLALRLRVSFLCLAAIGVLALVSGYSGAIAAAILLAGLSQSSETVSDIYYGAMQRRDQMERIARSMILRGVLSAACFGAVLWATHNLIWALGAVVVARLTLLAAYDRPAGSAGACLSRSGFRAELAILRTALPLGVVLMLVSLNTNLPRYAIEHYRGVRELGAFAAVASFVAVGSTIVNALGQAATPRLARDFTRRDRGSFRRLTLKLGALVLALGLAGVLAAAVAGGPLLRLLYRPEYAAYNGLLVGVMSAAVLGYLAIGLGYVLTSTRAFGPQAPLFCVSAATCGLASWVLVPGFGLAGAVLAMALAASVQLGGGAIILARALRVMETAS